MAFRQITPGEKLPPGQKQPRLKAKNHKGGKAPVSSVDAPVALLSAGWETINVLA